MINRLYKVFNVLFSFFDQQRFLIYEKIYLRIVRFKFLSEKKNFEDHTIDIILPTYNRSKLLYERSIPSVLGQTYKNFRLLIIGDCCTDDTEKIVNSFNDDRILFLKIHNRKKRYPPTPENHWFAGPVVAINYGLNFIKSDWIARIDDDDIWTSDHLEKLLLHVLKKNSEFVSSSYTVIKNDEEIIKNFENKKPAIGGVQTWLYRSYLKFFKANINCWRKSWNKVNDLDLQNRFYLAGVKMNYLNLSTCIIKPRPGDNEIGLKAYKSNPLDYIKKYEFK
jgi:glycosyltransferase involved in cell wall biosynthesis